MVTHTTVHSAALALLAERASEEADKEIATAWSESPTGQTPACGRGCSYCCQGVLVAVTIPEVIRIARYLVTVREADVDGVRERAATNASKTRDKGALDYPVRLPCALLDQETGECRVYPVRPMMCRKEHSLDAAECRRGFETQSPGVDYEIPQALAPLTAADRVMDSYREALRRADADADPYELQGALHIALTNRDSVAQWLRNEPSFARARFNPNTPKLVELRKK